MKNHLHLQEDLENKNTIKNNKKDIKAIKVNSVIFCQVLDDF